MGLREVAGPPQRCLEDLGGGSDSDRFSVFWDSIMGGILGVFLLFFCSIVQLMF